jgi:hypothetical protein
MHISIALVGCLAALVPAVFAVPAGHGHGRGSRGPGNATKQEASTSTGPQVSLFDLPQKITPPSGNNLAAVFWGQGIPS